MNAGLTAQRMTPDILDWHSVTAGTLGVIASTVEHFTFRSDTGSIRYPSTVNASSTKDLNGAEYLTAYLVANCLSFSMWLDGLKMKLRETEIIPSEMKKWAAESLTPNMS